LSGAIYISTSIQPTRPKVFARQKNILVCEWSILNNLTQSDKYKNKTLAVNQAEKINMIFEHSQPAQFPAKYKACEKSHFQCHIII
jgi:hypothetical protein